jgi:hypothetical protein
LEHHISKVIGELAIETGSSTVRYDVNQSRRIFGLASKILQQGDWADYYLSAENTDIGQRRSTAGGGFARQPTPVKTSSGEYDWREPELTYTETQIKGKIETVYHLFNLLNDELLRGRPEVPLGPPQLRCEPPPPLVEVIGLSYGIDEAAQQSYRIDDDPVFLDLSNFNRVFPTCAPVEQ